MIILIKIAYAILWITLLIIGIILLIPYTLLDSLITALDYFIEKVEIKIYAEIDTVKEEMKKNGRDIKF